MTVGGGAKYQGADLPELDSPSPACHISVASAAAGADDGLNTLESG